MLGKVREGGRRQDSIGRGRKPPTPGERGGGRGERRGKKDMLNPNEFTKEVGGV